MKKSIFTFLIAITALGFIGCGSESSSGDSASSSGDSSATKTTFEDKVVVHSLSDPEGLHPSNVSDASATEMKRYLMQKLLYIDFKTLELRPWLAAKLPELKITKNADGTDGMEITYELRPEAKWDDGSPVTVADIEFSFKSVINPKTDAASLRPYLDFIKEFKTYPDNPQKFTFICSKTNMIWDHVTGNDVWISQKKILDPEGLSDKFTIKDFATNGAKVAEDADNLKFAKNYNDIKYHREKGFVNGSGPYEFDSWVTNQRITFKRKKNWWGDALAGKAGMMFDKGPETIVFETINDMTTALTALKAGKLDAMTSIRSKDWVDDLTKSEKFNKNFQKSEPPFPIYTYIGMDNRSPKFSGKKTRQALSHLVDADGINKTLLYGLSYRIVGPIPKSSKADYNNDIELYPFDIAKAKQLLAEDGWKDTDGNGIVDKMINGVKTDFKIEFAYNQGNDTRKKVGLAMKEAARQAGVDITVSSMEWSVFLERLKNHQIEMWYGAWVFDTRPSDPKQIWHTSSYNGGSNYTGFGNAETDKLIESIRSEMDPAKRSDLYKKWQEILHEEAPYIFLYSGNRRNVIHKRFTNLNEGARDPGYWGGGFQLAPGFSHSN